MRFYCILLATVIFVGGLAAIYTKDRSLGLRNRGYVLRSTRRQLDGIADYLRAYHKQTGRYPTNDEGLLVVKPLVKACAADEFGKSPVSICRVGQGGILSLWGEPYIYENRRGLDVRKFAGFPAAGHISVMVDDGIYVSCLGAERSYRVYAYWNPLLKWSAGGVLLVTLALCLLPSLVSFQFRVREFGAFRAVAGGLAGALLNAIVPLFVGLVAFPAFVRSCYAASPYRVRSPELTKDYVRVIAKYRDRGVISETSYNKLIKALDHDSEVR